MCLIAYSRSGRPITRDVFESAFFYNADGIGIMSGLDVARYVGPSAKRRAWEHVKHLNRREAPFAVHWRFATHGQVDMGNCHPHVTNNGVYVMHNGVLSGFGDPSGIRSDTAQFVAEVLRDAPPVSDQDYYADIEQFIGFSNKFLVMDGTGEFHICNDYLGEWIQGIWYSNTYSLPDNMQPTRVHRHVTTAQQDNDDLKSWFKAQFPALPNGNTY